MTHELQWNFCVDIVLVYSHFSKMNEEKMATYKDFCKSMDTKDPSEYLLQDLKVSVFSTLWF